MESKTSQHVAYRLKAIEVLGGCCAKCGYREEPRILQIDHVTPQGNVKANRGSHRRLTIRQAARGHTEGLQLLCPNCHALKSLDENTGLPIGDC